jgi:hypothetical protein
MSQPSPDALAVVRAAEALTTQVRRIADALSTSTTDVAVRTDDDATTPVTTCGVSAVTPFGPLGPCSLRAHDGPVHKAGETTFWRTEQPPAADDEPAPNMLRVLADRAARGVLTPGEDEALRRRVEQMINGRETWKQKAEAMEQDRDRLAAEVERLGDWYRAVSERASTAEAERDRVHQEFAVNEADRVAAVRRAEQAEDAIERVRALADQFSREDDRGSLGVGYRSAGRQLRAALDGTEPTPEA